MADPRHEKLAKVLVRYSLALQPREKFVIYSHVTAAPLIQEVFREAVRAGAFVTTHISAVNHISRDMDGVNDIILREGNDEQLAHISEQWQREVETYDAELVIAAQANTMATANVPQDRLKKAQEARSTLMQRWSERTANKKLRWCYTQFPTNAYAQDAGLSLDEWETFVYGAELLDAADPAAEWRKVHDSQQHIADYLTQHNEIHIVAPDTDVTYHVGGRLWINADGKVNFPDGEVFSAPIENSVNGKVRFSYPGVVQGQQVEDIRLTFEAGKVIEADALRGAAYLHKQLDTDAGSRFLGEVAFGTNYNIARYSRNILFDEKIGGTMHMALGNTYPETGGKNKSNIHWDMICDLHEGKVYADGDLCYADGKFII